MTAAAAAVAASAATAMGSPAAPPPGCCVLTAADSGDLFRIQRGQIVHVQLAGSLQAPWTAPRSTTSAVVRLRVTRSGRQVVGVFVARRRGRAELRALQEPLCRKATPPCGAPTRVFLVHLVVG